MTRRAATEEQLLSMEQMIDEWFAQQQAELPILLDVSRDEDIPRRW